MMNMRLLRDHKNVPKVISKCKEIEETKIIIKALDYELKGLVCQRSQQGIELSTQPQTYTKVDVFQRDTYIHASLDLKGSLLPLKLKLRVAGDPRGPLPEDLAIYMS